MQRIIAVVLFIGTKPGLMIKEKNCFELLAVDFIVDEKFKPILLDIS